MKGKNDGVFSLSAAAVIRKLLLAWLISAAIEYTLSTGSLSTLDTLSEMSLIRLGAVFAGVFTLCIALNNRLSASVERWCMVFSFLWLGGVSLYTTFTPAFFWTCCFILGILIVYAIRGWDGALPITESQPHTRKFWIWIVGLFGIAFFLFVSIWTVCRVISFCTPSYDFGIFSQMFHSMKKTGLPITTLERDGALSHFKVHVSPIYYLLLPFYCLVPTPETLQVLQAAILASAVIPLWLLGKRHNLPPAVRALVCILLLLYPAYSGGASYDIHENAFLTPLILWMLYAIDSKKNYLSILFCILILMVKEDAAVYSAVIALYVILRSILSSKEHSQLGLGIFLLSISVGWFFAVTAYLSGSGDGVMTYRYDNFIYDGSSSLFTVIKAVLLCPMKAVFECVNPEKLKFIGYTLLPLLGLPFITRRYERYLLLIPYVLVNLMSDYTYQHDIFFQYTYGSTTCLFYLVVVNLTDIKPNPARLGALTAATAITATCFIGAVIPKAQPYPLYCKENGQHYAQIRQTLDQIPDDASVCATTFYTTYLSQRDILYDVRYASTEHLLDCEYVVLTTTSESCYKSYAVNGENGLNNLIALLEQNGYVLSGQLEGTLVIYKKA